MEKLIAAITGMASNIPVLAWVGYIHFSRPSRKECELKHKASEAAFTGMCGKLDLIISRQKEIHEILMRHVSRKDE
jgi:hypothetical protein